MLALAKPNRVSLARCLQATLPMTQAFRSSPSDALRAPPRCPTASRAPLFEGVFLGGFECSCQKLANGRRLDMLSTTRHDELADRDYALLRSVGMTACRDGAPWAAHERAGRYDFTRLARMQHAAARRGVDVVWDLMHFGWPDDVDPFGAAFPVRFGRYAAAFARWLSGETDRCADDRADQRDVVPRVGRRRRSLHESVRGCARRRAQGRSSCARPSRPSRRFAPCCPALALPAARAGHPHRASGGPPEDVGARRVRRPAPVPGVGHAHRSGLALPRRAPRTTSTSSA